MKNPFLSTLVRVATLAALLASLYDATAQVPYIAVFGSARGGQIYYSGEYPYVLPGVTDLDVNDYYADVSREAKTMGSVSYSRSVLDGSYLMSVDLLTGKLRVSARAPSYS